MKRQNTMAKVKIFVHCTGWSTGGYDNTLYFENEKKAKEWAKRHDDVEIVSIQTVTLDEFAEDYIGEL